MTVTVERPTGRKVTPTGRLVLPADAPRAQWLAARRAGLGSSDISAVLGLRSTNLHVYYNKIGVLPDDEDAGEAALWGTLHEDTIAGEWARRNHSAVRRVGLVAQDGHPHRMCTLDRRVTVCPLDADRRESCALEIKTRSAFKAGQWRKGTPDDVTAQVLWQHRVTGYDHVHVACLIGGNDYRQFTVLAAQHLDVIRDITTAADRLWHEHIARRVPPAPVGDPDALVDLYDVLNPGRGGVVHLDRDPDAYWALSEYVEALGVETAAKARKDAAKAQMVGALGDAEVALLEDTAAYTYLESTRTSVDAARLADRWPEAYADCVRQSPSRRLNVTREWRRRLS